jgi:hypothetical protein
VRLVRHGRYCWMCARKRLMETVPREREDQPLPNPRVYVADGRSVKPMSERFERLDMGATLRKHILSRRELERENATDSKLKASGD